MDYLFRFGSPRLYQKEMIDDIYLALKSKQDILINAPTGIGKTDASLSAALTFALGNGNDIFFLTPKMSQHKIVVEVLKGLKAKYKLNFRFVDLVGKQTLCTNENINMRPSSTFYNACAKLLKERRCQYYKQVAEDIPEEVMAASMSGHNALFSIAYDYGMCAYEITTKLARSSKVIIADYAHILNPSVRTMFLKKIAHSLDNAILIWDEAHNIIEASESYLTGNLSIQTIDKAMQEILVLNKDFDVSYISFAIKKLAEAKLKNNKKEALISKNDLPEEISSSLESITNNLDKFALEYNEIHPNKYPYMSRLSGFLKKWAIESDSVARIIKKDEKNISIKLICLYPKEVLHVLDTTYSNIFMSGTLAPLEMYANMFGARNPILKNYLSPFPKSNKISFIDSEVTTKYEHRSAFEYIKIAKKLTAFKEAIPGNVAVFFPSFSVLNAILRYLNGVSVVIQRESMGSMQIEKLLENFYKSKDTMLLAVMGGSLSEGIDYSNNIIKGIAIVGIPFAKPDLELSMKIAYLDTLFPGNGDNYAYRIPALVKTLQAIGRAIRNESDKAVILFMDKRYAWRAYYQIIESAGEIMHNSNYLESITTFWKNANKELNIAK
ncbi:MAG: ATP-dependent DNA helicase [Candidatus Micrarchaeaceae archaeon]